MPGELNATEPYPPPRGHIQVGQDGEVPAPGAATAAAPSVRDKCLPAGVPGDPAIVDRGCLTARVLGDFLALGMSSRALPVQCWLGQQVEAGAASAVILPW